MTVETVDMTLDWMRMRRWVIRLAATDLDAALRINREMGKEGAAEAILYDEAKVAAAMGGTKGEA